MSYLVTVTFDVENASSQNYTDITNSLQTLGLFTFIKAHDNRNIYLPSNTYSGEFNGISVEKIRNDVCERVQNVFLKLNIKGKIYVVVGGDWGWGIRTT